MQSRASDYLRYERKPLDAIFAPRSIALVGASEKPDSLGRNLMTNLVVNTFGGAVYPINPKRHSVLGVKAYPTLSDAPGAIDLAVISTPAPTVPAIIRECAALGVRGAVIISAGFKETGAAGVALEQEILATARRANIRLIGPNCMGVMRPQAQLNATFATAMALPGNVGFISQSGALCAAVLDWSLRENVGFSAFVSVGSMLDVGWGDLIDYLGSDPHTRSIVIYMETIGNARAFLSAAREVALTKPVIVIKPGRTAAGAAAAASHTGSLTGSDEVLDAAFHRAGVLRVNTLADLFHMAEVLAKQPRPRGRRLTILTNAGGPGVLAADALVSHGGELAPLPEETVATLNDLLPPFWSRANPIDTLGDTDADRYAAVLDQLIANPESDGTLLVLGPLSLADPEKTARMVVARTQESRKPVLASWIGGSSMEAGIQVLNQANIPTFAFPDTAARMFGYMAGYSEMLERLYETPQIVFDETARLPRAGVAQTLQSIRQSGRTMLTEKEAKEVLAAYGIPVVTTRFAATPDEAVARAAAIGYPVVLKLNSTVITHKTDVNGVQLNLHNENQVRAAFARIRQGVADAGNEAAFDGVTVQPMLRVSQSTELIIGASPDPQFGPVILFGAGGTLVEVFRDYALTLPPLTTTLAHHLIDATRVARALGGVRGGAPVDRDALAQLLVLFSALVAEQRIIKEIEINPLLAAPDALLALDARIVLYDPDLPLADIPRLAIRPYPNQYASPWVLRDGTPVNIRPIRPEDEPLLVQFHSRLSEQSVFNRYFSALQLSRRVAHERLTRMCFIDYDREMALVVTRAQAESDVREIIGVGRLSRPDNMPEEAEFSIVIVDAYQRSGLGSELLRRLVDIARQEGVSRVTAYMLPTNGGMRRVSEKTGFTFSFEDGLIRARLDLLPAAEQAGP